eukprot:2408357-Rhodomonas_salina.1
MLGYSPAQLLPPSPPASFALLPPPSSRAPSESSPSSESWQIHHSESFTPGSLPGSLTSLSSSLLPPLLRLQIPP